jgi:chromosome segregation ATPase
VFEDELKRANERAELAEGKLRDVEQELESVGENMKQLEISAEKATEREEKLKDKIHLLMERLKIAEARYEYGEMNITKLNHRIDDIEDEIYREKLKIKKVSDELSDTNRIFTANYKTDAFHAFIDDPWL